MGPPIRDKRTCTWHGSEHVAPVVETREIEKREKGGGVDDGAVIARSAMLLQGLSGEREGRVDSIQWMTTIGPPFISRTVCDTSEKWEQNEFRCIGSFVSFSFG